MNTVTANKNQSSQEPLSAKGLLLNTKIPHDVSSEGDLETNFPLDNPERDDYTSYSQLQGSGIETAFSKELEHLPKKDPFLENTQFIPQQRDHPTEEAVETPKTVDLFLHDKADSVFFCEVNEESKYKIAEEMKNEDKSSGSLGNLINVSRISLKEPEEQKEKENNVPEDIQNPTTNLHQEVLSVGEEENEDGENNIPENIDFSLDSILQDFQEWLGQSEVEEICYTEHDFDKTFQHSQIEKEQDEQEQIETESENSDKNLLSQYIPRALNDGQMQEDQEEQNETENGIHDNIDNFLSPDLIIIVEEEEIEIGVGNAKENEKLKSIGKTSNGASLSPIFKNFSTSENHNFNGEHLPDLSPPIENEEQEIGD